MDDETFIAHLLNSLPQSEYKGAILVIKDKLRKGPVELPEIEQVLEDKYKAMKHAKGWEEEEDDYALLTSPSNKKKPKKAFKGYCGYCGELGHKAADCPNKKSNKKRVRKQKHSKRKSRMERGLQRQRTFKYVNVLIVENMGIFSRDCLKSCNNANIAQESEQKGQLETMLDLDSTSVCDKCAMVCTELQYEDADEDQIVYGDQGINAEEYKKAMYSNLMKTQSKEEDEVKCTVAQRANDSVM